MKGFRINLSNSTYVEFPNGKDSLPPILDWFREAGADSVITLNPATGGVVHLQKRHIVQIEEL